MSINLNQIKNGSFKCIERGHAEHCFDDCLRFFRNTLILSSNPQIPSYIVSTIGDRRDPLNDTVVVPIESDIGVYYETYVFEAVIGTDFITAIGRRCIKVPIANFIFEDYMNDLADIMHNKHIEFMLSELMKSEPKILKTLPRKGVYVR